MVKTMFGVVLMSWVCVGGYLGITYAMQPAKPAKATKAECESLMRDFENSIRDTVKSRNDLDHAMKVLSKKKTLTEDDKSTLEFKSSVLSTYLVIGDLNEISVKQCVMRLAQGK